MLPENVPHQNEGINQGEVMKYRKQKIQFKGNKGNLKRQLFNRYSRQEVQVGSGRKAQEHEMNRIFDENEYLEMRGQCKFKLMVSTHHK